VALGLSDKAVVRRVEHARAQPDESRRSAREWQELRGVWRVGPNPAFDAFQAGRATNVVIVTETRKSCWDLGGEGTGHAIINATNGRARTPSANCCALALSHATPAQSLDRRGASI
jgi:hypothetical protein